MTPTSQAVSLFFLFFGVGFASACSGGSPASPGNTAADASSSDEVSTDVPVADGGTSDGASDAAAFANCGTIPATGSIPADVLAVMSAKCQTCHQNPPLNDAPFPLLTYADVHSLFGTVPKYQEMHFLIQPDGSPHMPFGKAPQLTAAEFSTLDDWLLDCAPPGE